MLVRALDYVSGVLVLSLSFVLVVLCAIELMSSLFPCLSFFSCEVKG